MIAAIRVSYKSPTVRIAINKHLAQALTLMCGVLQGDPLSVLLYIITIQPLLYALKAAGIGITVTWEGRSARLSSMAHADDLVVFLANELQFRSAQPITELYCHVSNSLMHRGKATVIASGPTTGWQSQVDMKRESGDYSHMGCPMRADGQSPEGGLQATLATMRQAAYIWDLAARPLPTRVEIMNTFILSKIWHATQICPLYPQYSPAVQVIVTKFVFGRSHALIDFEKACFPKAFGGLGLHHPEKMMMVLNGKVVARMVINNGELGMAFRIQFLRVLAAEGGCFFRLLAKAKWAFSGKTMPNTGPPFWQRIYDTCLNLDLSVSKDWDEYTDEELLSLPFDTDTIWGENTELFAKRVRSALFPIRICLLRDILVFRRNERGNKFQVRNSDESSRLIQRRMIQLQPEIAANRQLHFDKTRQTGPYYTATKGMQDIRRYWGKLWENAPEKFKERLTKIRTLPASLLPMMVGSQDDFDVTSTYDLIPWEKLTLAGVPCRNYTVRIGRMKATNAYVLEPEWGDIRPEDGTNIRERTAQLWRKAWGISTWKYRPAPHYEAHWKLLHKRVQHAMNLHLQDPKLRYKNGKCKNCGAEDTTEHAFITCPEVRRIWTDATEVLHKILGRWEGLAIDHSEREIVLAYPKLRESLPGPLRMRVVLWHSAVVYAITVRREACIKNVPMTDEGMQFDFGGWEKIVKAQVGRVLWDIYEDFKQRGELPGFGTQWVVDNRMVRLDGLGQLAYQE